MQLIVQPFAHTAHRVTDTCSEVENEVSIDL